MIFNDISSLLTSCVLASLTFSFAARHTAHYTRKNGYATEAITYSAVGVDEIVTGILTAAISNKMMVANALLMVANALL